MVVVAAAVVGVVVAVGSGGCALSMLRSPEEVNAFVLFCISTFNFTVKKIRFSYNKFKRK